MTTLKNEALVLFNCRSYLYELFQVIFGTEPDLELLKLLADYDVSEALGLFGACGTSGYNEAVKAFQQASGGFDENGLENLQREYMNLLIGPAKLPAPPYESVYITEERLLFQKNTLDVRNAYLDFGVLPAEYPHVPDDHLTYELAFMARLNKIARNAYIEGDHAGLKETLAASSSFLKKHLLVWVPSFARHITKVKNAVFYPVAAVMLERFLIADETALGELSEL